MPASIPIAQAVAFSRPGTIELTQLPPLSLYVHMPWCVRKCPYCDFNSHAAPEHLPDEAAYIHALLADLEQELPRIWGRSVHSVFIGGGTPSLFQGAPIAQLLDGIRARVRLVPEAEITLEANPGTFERARFAAYRDAGVNRLSLGVQSFDDHALAALGRIHSGDDARRALESALTIFARVNADLMYALPAQTPDLAVADLATAIRLGIPHISAYQLTLEPNTAFGHSPPPRLPEEEAAEAIEQAVHATLAEAGFVRYEVSAFCRDGAPARHNLNYWQFGDYIGIGAGAHGKISFADRIERSSKLRHPQAYLDAIHRGRSADARRFRVPESDLAFEFLLNALRLKDGVPAAFFSERTGLPLAQIAPQLKRAVQDGLIDPDPTRLAATPHGWRFLNHVLERFLPSSGA